MILGVRVVLCDWNGRKGIGNVVAGGAFDPSFALPPDPVVPWRPSTTKSRSNTKRGQNTSEGAPGQSRRT